MGGKFAINALALLIRFGTPVEGLFVEAADRRPAEVVAPSKSVAEALMTVFEKPVFTGATAGKPVPTGLAFAGAAAGRLVAVPYVPMVVRAPTGVLEVALVEVRTEARAREDAEVLGCLAPA